jgi:hypothetical protein
LAAERFDYFLSTHAAPIDIPRFFNLLVLIRNSDSSIKFQFHALERPDHLIDVRISKTFVFQIFVNYAREHEVQLSGIFWLDRSLRRFG